MWNSLEEKKLGFFSRILGWLKNIKIVWKKEIWPNSCSVQNAEFAQWLAKASLSYNAAICSMREDAKEV